MCGIAGLIGEAAREPSVLARMAGAIRHRGPDDEGLWSDPEVGIGLASRRLAIVDLSPLGHQPMESSDGRFVLSFNGEIYNHRALRALLEQSGSAPAGGWRGQSDTETLVECIAALGLDSAVAQAVGMFAFALWDRSERRLHLIRDRFGEKPLYYGWAGRDFVWGSELKALRAHPGFRSAVDRRALAAYVERGYVPAPLSIYQNVFKLPPGCILDIGPGPVPEPRSDPPAEGECDGGLRLRRYWSYAEVVRSGLADPIADEREALAALDSALSDSIRGQSVADVPVGAFLSGGIDSSTVVAFYQKHSPRPVRTFSIGFAEAGYDEAGDARAVARHFGTVHDELYVTVAEAREVIPLLPSIYDEPFADSSQVPTYLVSRFARGSVTVALSGDGGDELFAGYARHFQAPLLWRRLRRIPRPLRAMAGAPLGRLPSGLWQGAAELLPGRTQPHAGRKIQKSLRLAGLAQSFDDVCSGYLDEWSLEGSPVLGAGDGWPAPGLGLGAAPDPVRMMHSDAVTYLPDDILCKVDRAAMAVSLETRVPFLDHRLAATAARVPLDLKVRGGRGKHILRRLLEREAPASLFDRPKAGFAIPVGDWLRGPLRDWGEALLDPARLAGEGWFDVARVRRRWDDHLAGRRDSTPALWALLMFQAWLDAEAGRLAEAA